MTNPKAGQIDVLMERATEALVQTSYFEAERMANKALGMARQINDFDRLARITLPLQEARRQRVLQAFDVGKIRILDAPISEDTRIRPGCYLVTPPLVSADARRLRLKALQDDVPVAVVCREPSTDLGLVPVVAIGRVTVRVRIDPPADHDAPDLDWFIAAMEALGDTAIEELDARLEPVRLVDALFDRLDTVPEHEQLHQHLAQAARSAAHAALEKQAQTAERTST